jgi:hypothetical protein
MVRQRNQVRVLEGEPLEAGRTTQTALVDHRVEPLNELRPHVGEVAKLARIEKRSFELPERSLGPRLVLGVAAANNERAVARALRGARKRVELGGRVVLLESEWPVLIRRDARGPLCQDARAGAATHRGRAVKS